MRAANTLNIGSAPDCYAVVSLHEARIAHTHIDRRTNHPRWGERFIVPVAHDVDALTVTVKDKDLVGSNFMGQARALSYVTRPGGADMTVSAATCKPPPMLVKGQMLRHAWHGGSEGCLWRQRSCSIRGPARRRKGSAASTDYGWRIA